MHKKLKKYFYTRKPLLLKRNKTKTQNKIKIFGNVVYARSINFICPGKHEVEFKADTCHKLILLNTWYNFDVYILWYELLFLVFQLCIDLMRSAHFNWNCIVCSYNILLHHWSMLEEGLVPANIINCICLSQVGTLISVTLRCWFLCYFASFSRVFGSGCIPLSTMLTVILVGMISLFSIYIFIIFV